MASVRSDIDVLVELNALCSRLWRTTSLRAGLEEMLSATLGLLSATKGTVQLFDPELGVLRIAAQRGFEDTFLDHFREVAATDDSACAIALRTGQRYIVEDSELDATFARYRKEARAAGIRAMQSTPLVDRTGAPLGVFSTYFPEPRRPDERDLRQLDLYVSQAANFIERLNTEEALRESEARFARFMHHLPGLAWIKDGRGRYVFANDAAEDAFQVPHEKLLGRTDAEIFPPDTAAQFVEHDRRALASRTGVQVIETLEHADGALHHALVSKFPMPGVNSEEPFIGGMAIDITEHKRAEDALHRSEERFRALAESASVLIWVNGLDGCEFVNRTYRDFLGVNDADVRGYDWAQFVHPDDRDAYLAAYRRAIDSRADFEAEFRFRRHDGEYRWMRSVGRPRFGPDGELIGYAGSSLDITEHKRAEDELKEADRRKDQFLATLAHELRNPLAPLRSGLEVMKLARDDAPLIENVRTMMERQLGHMVRLVDDLLDVSRINLGRVTIRRERLNLADLVQQALETTRAAIEQADHTLVVTLPKEPLYLDGDATRLSQVFSNLLSNAAKFTNPGGRLWLTVSRDDAEAVVSVRDTGIGIPPAMLDRVFEVFTQVDWSIERAQGGLGIGLSLVKALVEMHGGRVAARSEGHGKGSEFIVRLPLADSRTPGAERPVSEAGVRPTRRRILVVDDNGDAAASLAMMLDTLGNETRTAHDGEAALAVAAAFDPDVILLDIGMPKLNGYEVARHVRKQPRGQDVVLIAITGWDQDTVRERTRAAGFDAHLVKPIESAELAKVLASATRGLRGASASSS